MGSAQGDVASMFETGTLNCPARTLKFVFLRLYVAVFHVRLAGDVDLGDGRQPLHRRAVMKADARGGNGEIERIEFTGDGVEIPVEGDSFAAIVLGARDHTPLQFEGTETELLQAGSSFLLLLVLVPLAVFPAFFFFPLPSSSAGGTAGSAGPGAAAVVSAFSAAPPGSAVVVGLVSTGSGAGVSVGGATPPSPGSGAARADSVAGAAPPSRGGSCA